MSHVVSDAVERDRLTFYFGIRQYKASCVSQHVWMNTPGELSSLSSALHNLVDAITGERSSALTGEDENAASVDF